LAGWTQGAVLEVVAEGPVQVDGEKDISVRLRNEVPIRAVQFAIRFDPDIVSSWSLVSCGRASGFSLRRANAVGDEVRVFLVDLEGDELPAGEGEVARLRYTTSRSGRTPLKLCEVVLADPDAEPVPVELRHGEVLVLAPPAQIVLDTTGVTAKVGTSVEFWVTVKDRFYNPVPGVEVRFRVSVGGGRVSPATAKTDSSGRARATLVLGPEPGMNAVTVSAGGVPDVTFTAVGTLTGPEGGEEEEVIQLARGFNLISLPLEPSEEITAFGLLGRVHGSVSVTRFSEGTQRFEDAFSLGSGKFLGSDFPIELGRGYFLQVREATSLRLRGRRVSAPVPLDLRRGFNLVGFPDGASRTAFGLLREIEDAVAVIRFREDLQRFENAFKVGGTVLGTDFPIERGRGYFLQVGRDISGFSPAKLAPSGAMPYIIYGRAEPGARVEVLVSGSYELTTYAGSSGRWDLNLADLGVRGRYLWKVGDEVYVRAEGPEGDVYEGRAVISGLCPQEVALVHTGTSEVLWLGRPYPNPSNFGIFVPYRLPRTMEVSLRIYSVDGRAIRTLSSGTMPGGLHLSYWDGRDSCGRDVSSGVYLVVLEGEGTRRVGKALLVR